MDENKDFGDWLRKAMELAGSDEEVRKYGVTYLNLAVETCSDTGGCHRYGICFDGYDIDYVGEIAAGAAGDGFEYECVIIGAEDVWREIATNIETHGGADLTHTLNSLSLADEPLRVDSPDPMGRDKFFRYQASIQEAFNAAGRQAVSA